MNRQLLASIEADDEVCYEAVSLRDQDWTPASSIIKKAWEEGYRTFAVDDGALLFKELAKDLPLNGIDCPPITYKKLEDLLEAAKENWWINWAEDEEDDDEG